MELKKKLSKLRKGKGLTQLELAETLDVSRQAVSRWEVGTAVPSLDNLMALSQLYGVPVDYLVRDELEKPELEELPSAGPIPAKSKQSMPTRYLAGFAILVLLLTVGALIFGSHPQITERNDIMDLVNSIRASAYLPIQSAVQQTAKPSAFTEQAQSYYGVSGNGGATPLISPLLQLRLDYNRWKESQPPQTLPDSQGPAEENLAYLREHYPGQLTMFQKIEALDAMFDMGIITREQRNEMYGINNLETFQVTDPSQPLQGSALEKDFDSSHMAQLEQNLYRLSPLAKSDTLDDLFSWLDGIGA